MAVVKSFRGLRPRPDIAEKVASPPYDVLSAEEARRIAKDNSITFLRVNKAELEFDGDIDQYSDVVYQRGKENLASLIREGVMFRDKLPSFYLYRLTWKGESQTGLVTLTSVEDYTNGLIKKHEETRPEKVADRANHIIALQAQVGPVFSIFKGNDEISTLFSSATSKKPDTSFEAEDGVIHELWVISESDTIEKIRKAYDSLEALYIADGHHRSAAAAEVAKRYREEYADEAQIQLSGYFLNVLFADRELRILPYNRVVKDLNSLTVEQLIEKVSERFLVTAESSSVEPENQGEFGLYVDSNWYKLTAKPESVDKADPVKSIDAAVLADNLLAPILGISDPRTDKRIDFVGGIRGNKELMRLVDSGEFAAAFSLYPTSIEQLLNVADAGKTMPPKSTWFEPKLRSGMVVNLLAE